jgi:hypothetical protein
VDLEALLAPEELKDLFMKQKIPFLNKNVNKFKQCPTPDCENILCSPEFSEGIQEPLNLSSKGLVFCDSCGNDCCFYCQKSHYDTDCKGNKLKEVD